MNSFPPLIPIPSAPSSSDAKEQLDEEFATLFSPPTPRASPEPSSDIFKPLPRSSSSNQHDASNSPDSEFGSFVSVPPSEDPLSFTALSLANEKPPSFSSRHVKTPSWSFFDSFAQEAKAAHERNKRDVMDELLHEENRSKGSQSLRNTSEQSTEAADSLLDLDLNFFTPRSESVTPQDHASYSHNSNTQHTLRHKPSSSPQMLTRKSTLSLPHGPAPPIASTSSALSSPRTENVPDTESTIVQSPSYQTLSNISSRWMSSLLKPSPSESLPSGTSEFEQPSPSITASLPVFNTHARSQSASSSDSWVPRHSQTFPFPTSLASSFSSSFTSSLPSTSSIQPTMHSGIHHSPFAPHVFVAPSGAPGFKPEGYDWDKGYSGDLDKELLETGKNSSGPSKSLIVPGKQPISRRSSPVDRNLIPGLPSLNSQPHTRSQTPSPVPSMGIGGLIEKKAGNLELKGRREATVAVLNVNLAEMIRSRLPALARLPRSWNLLYSLDQHGISLHTLYDMCENQPQLKIGSAFASKVGALVVMKDSGDAIFGVYMGDGVRQSKGKGYYGSGESFLWRCVDGNLQVFKWTGKNEYVALCEAEYLSFGGGDGAYGLYLDDSLFDGSSARCPTFDNEPLCSPGEKKGRAVSFECVGLEVWGVGP
ncbi:TLD-domain-containing protein [Lentinula detonsa]|uniref:Oxidation resistance protein 1 n=1 Tax=Lentinula detonsa TaxID=2804962 RepID=A0A9W8P511_9AGAR|nr:TLD-domain-containing protein [Lentinula detonsa]